MSGKSVPSEPSYDGLEFLVTEGLEVCHGSAHYFALLPLYRLSVSLVDQNLERLRPCSNIGKLYLYLLLAARACSPSGRAGFERGAETVEDQLVVLLGIQPQPIPDVTGHPRAQRAILQG
jgi:hypothetical protein